MPGPASHRPDPAHPSIPDIRWAVTLDLLRAIDADFPARVEEFLERVEEALGDAHWSRLPTCAATWSR